MPQDSTSNPDHTHQRILDAASRMFAQKGFAGSTTRAIAELAEVNEVTLFRHFGSKENLAKAVMDRFGGSAIAEDFQKQLSGDYTQDLSMVARVMLEVMTQRRDAIRMAICEASTFPEFRNVVADNPRQLRKTLARYFQEKMDEGYIYPGHAEMLAQAFLGMFFSYTVLEGFFKESLQPEISQDEIVEQFVTLFVRGTIVSQE